MGSEVLVYILTPLAVYFILRSSSSNSNRVGNIIKGLLVILTLTSLVPFHPINNDNITLYSVLDLALRQQHPTFALTILLYLVTLILFTRTKHYLPAFIIFLGAFAASMYAVFTGDIGRSQFILDNYPNNLYWLATGVPLVYFLAGQLTFFLFIAFLRYYFSLKKKK